MVAGLLSIYKLIIYNNNIKEKIDLSCTHDSPLNTDSNRILKTWLTFKASLINMVRAIKVVDGLSLNCCQALGTILLYEQFGVAILCSCVYKYE